MFLDRIKQQVIARLPRKVLLRLGRHNRGRYAVGKRHLHGRGIEIGALSQPLLVAPAVHVDYVDQMTKEAALSQFPGLSASHTVTPSYIGNGFELDFIESESQDFVIANHVLEHAPDPIGVLRNWARVLRAGGVIFVTVPLVDDCFDAGRPVTRLDHLVEDHRLVAVGDLDESWQRSRPHYEEWVDISIPGMSEGSAAATADERRRLVDELLGEHQEIHFHTFTTESFEDLLTHFCRNEEVGFAQREIIRNRTEVIGVIGRDISTERYRHDTRFRG